MFKMYSSSCLILWNWNIALFLSIIFMSTITKQKVDVASSTTRLQPYCGSRIRNNTGAVSVSNLQVVLSSLRSNATILGFNNSSFGQEPDNSTVYGNYLCRGEFSIDLCHECVTNASRDILQLCPDSSEAIAWFDQCTLRYSYRNFFGVLQTRPYWYVYKNSAPATPDVFTDSLFRKLIQSIRESNSMFVKDSFNGSGNQMRYGTVQCTRDLSLDNCILCLNVAFNYTKICCQEKYVGYQMLLPNCNLRFENFPFWLDQQPAPLPLPPPGVTNQSKKAGNRKSRRTLIIAITTSAFSFILIMIGGFLCRKRQKKVKNGSNQEAVRLGTGMEFWYDGSPVEDSVNPDLPLIPLGVIRLSTSDLSDECKLGEGWFGPVFKGELPDGKQVAVKRLSKVSSQGSEEFKNEVILIAKPQHRNLVRLLGCCIEDNEKLLVYEYMPNGSLALHLFDTRMKVQLYWQLRSSIISGIAKGLLYLHEDSRLRIIHRDLKASNILLDHQMNPRISDFGMARIFGGDQEQANTNRVVGTYGYMAPEYAMEGIFSVKSDVFSFGVLLLEIIAGKRNGGFYLSKRGQSLLTYLSTWNLWNEGKAMDLVDSVLLGKTYVISEAMKCIHIALLCVQEEATDRPTMSAAVIMLASDNATFLKPKQPAFSVGRMDRSTPVSVGSKKFSVNDMTISSVSPR